MIMHRSSLADYRRVVTVITCYIGTFLMYTAISSLAYAVWITTCPINVPCQINEAINAQTWQWDLVPEANSYRIYWSNSPNEWPDCQYYEAYECFEDNTCQGETEYLQGNVFFNIVAVDAYGKESTWDHGTKIACNPGQN